MGSQWRRSFQAACKNADTQGNHVVRVCNGEGDILQQELQVLLHHEHLAGAAHHDHPVQIAGLDLGICFYIVRRKRKMPLDFSALKC